MVKVNCFLETCVYNLNCECTNTEITLDEDHVCFGGCDDGWGFIAEDEDEEF